MKGRGRLERYIPTRSVYLPDIESLTNT
jgi:hypothetical protein